jgi:hypothetical protein
MAPSILDYHADEHWPWDWPPKANSVNQHDVSPDQYYCLRELLERTVGEREIEGFLSKDLEVLSLVMTSTGHHQSWVFPKEEIRPPSERIGGGLIPDYLLAGAGSFGVDWFVLELKGPDKRAFTKTGNSVVI